MTRKEVFTKNLRKLIENSGKSQIEIADAIGEKYTTFNMWVAYNGTMPRADKLQKIADYFGIGLDELMCEDHDIRIKSDLDVTIDVIRDMTPDMLERVRRYAEYLKYMEARNENTHSD